MHRLSFMDLLWNIQQMFTDFPEVCVFLDDILITGENLKKQAINTVLTHLDETGLAIFRLFSKFRFKAKVTFTCRDRDLFKWHT